MFSFFKKKKKVDTIETNDLENNNKIVKISEEYSKVHVDNNIETLIEIDNSAENKIPILQEDEVVINKISWFSRLKKGLSKSRKQFNKLFGIINIDESWLEELEDALILSDVGINATKDIMKDLRLYIKNHQPNAQDIKIILKKQIIEILKPLEKNLEIQEDITCIMMVGVNGAGKTTSIGKLCKHLQAGNQKIVLAAGDTFRAAASEQLQAWGKQNNVNVISNSGEPASVAFDAIQSAKAKNCDVVIIDTAGRLPTQNNLIEELKKVKRVSDKALNKNIDEILLVIDGNTGQNALQQVKIFDEAVKLSGLIITKLDGSAKGGIIIAIAKEYNIPIYFIGVGEGINDLQQFNASSFVDALFD